MNRRRSKDNLIESKKVSFSSIDEYITSFPADIQTRLQALRAAIHAAAPGAQEKISYQMPTFTLDGPLVYFAAFKQHISLYPTPSGIEALRHELTMAEIEKGTIRFPLDQPLPLDVIGKIVALRVAETLHKAGEKPARRKQRPPNENPDS